jgi:hypothetical protein
MNKALKKSVKKALRKLPSVREIIGAAKQGEAKKSWYQNAHSVIKDRYGDDARVFTAILAATSPRQTVELNLRMSKSMFAAWDLCGHDTGEIAEIAAKGVIQARVKNTVRALKGEALRGPKVTAFCANLSGDYNHVTIDTWMLTFAGLAHEKSFLNKGGILAYQRRVTRAARKLGWFPAEVQAAVWSYCYSRVNKCAIAEVPEFNFAEDLTNAADDAII